MSETSAAGSWEAEVWSIVKPVYTALKKKRPNSMSAEAHKTQNLEINIALQKTKEARHASFNIAWLDPTRMSIPSDVVCLAKSKKSALYHFYEDGVPCAPAVWPRGQNIPVAVLHPDVDHESLRHYGGDSVLCGFWYAFAQAIKLSRQEAAAAPSECGGPSAKKWEAIHAGFEKLCCSAFVDIKVFSAEEDVEMASFQLIEDNEEAREHNGFTGFRKILLVSWANDTLKKKWNRKVTKEEIADFLGKSLKFHDETMKPGVNTVRDLLNLVKHVLPNKRVLTAIQDLEMVFGRSTLFDDYSKLNSIVNKSRSAEDLAFMIELLCARMKKATKADTKPDNPSRSSLVAKAGELANVQLTRDAIQWIRNQACKTWAGHDDLVKALLMPAQFVSMNGNATTMAARLTGAPASVRCVVALLNGVYFSSSWARVASGVLNHPPSDGVDHEKLFTSAFPDEWAAFTETLKDGDTPPACGGDPGTKDGNTPPACGGDPAQKGKTGQPAVGADKLEEVKVSAKERAKDMMCFNPGITFVVPEAWCAQSLETALNGQHAHGRLGRCVAVFDPKADDDARVHTGQNAYLRYPPLNVDRFSAFLDSVTSVMREGVDFMVVFEGRVAENRAAMLREIEKRKLKLRETVWIADKAAQDHLLCT